MNRREVIITAVAVGCICVLVGLACRQRKTGNQSGSAAQSVPVSSEEARARIFDEAQARAFEAIRQRERWPESPEAVCKAFWVARAAKDYPEMEVLWPGSASFNWRETCKNEPNVIYVFGQAGADGTTVPYAAKDQFDARKTYNLTMRLRVLQTSKGPRHYIVSGN
jgi:hypothetical protein